jgi:hypothetical protein
LISCNNTCKKKKDIATQQALVQEIFSLVSKRPDTACNFLEGSKLLGGKDTRVIYRHYATLYFVFVVDESESELGILDLIQVKQRNPHLSTLFMDVIIGFC